MPNSNQLSGTVTIDVDIEFHYKYTGIQMTLKRALSQPNRHVSLYYTILRFILTNFMTLVLISKLHDIIYEAMSPWF